MKEIEIVSPTEEEALETISNHLRLPKETFDVVDTRIEDETLGDIPSNRCVRLRINLDQFLEVIRQKVLRLLEGMNIEAEVKVRPERDIIHVDLQSDESSLLIGRRGETLDALQHIMNRMVGRSEKAMPLIAMDVHNYRSRAHSRLKKIASQAAEKARKSNKTIRLEPMSSQDRKFIHKFLAEFRGIETQSVGRDSNRRITVSYNPTREELQQADEELMPEIVDKMDRKPDGGKRPLDRGPSIQSNRSSASKQKERDPDDLGELLDLDLLEE